MSTRDAITATRRFGLGGKPGDLQRIGSDARGYLSQALDRKDAALITTAALEPSHVVFANAQRANRELQMAKSFIEDGNKQLKGTATADGASATGAMMGAGDSMTAGDASQSKEAPAGQAKVAQSVIDKPQQIRRDAFQRELAARIEHAATIEDGFVERLVMFWSNHFCVNANKGPVLGLVGAFEREAIRPHVLGRFADMLLAVEQHPAMLIYLDNQASTGPNSPVGRARDRGLNENLAREILELHTLGVNGGYTQADVTNLARLITGWTVHQANPTNAESGQFQFAVNRHEPGTFSVLGKRYGNEAVAAGQRCLADLARHPSTARHIARKLAIHFVADEPPPALVLGLEAAFRNSGGDLAMVSRALLNSDEAWSAPPQKVVPPYDFMVALQRAFGLDHMPMLERLRLMAQLGQPLWRPPSPKGWPDGDESWAGPSALRERLRIAERLGLNLTQQGKDPRALADALFGDALSETTRQAVARAEAREQAFALLIMSPEFQRR